MADIQKVSSIKLVDVKNPNDPSDQPFRISQLIMGTGSLAQIVINSKKETMEEKREEAKLFLDEALKVGINTFDTAPIYVQEYLRRDGITDYVSSEDILGEWLAEVNVGRRSEITDSVIKNIGGTIYVISKGGFPIEDTSAPAGTYTSKLMGGKDKIVGNVFEESSGSLSRLKRFEEVSRSDRRLKCIIIYLLHRDDVSFVNFKPKDTGEQTSVKTILEALTELKSMPESRYDMFGVSNWKTDRIKEAQSVTEANTSLVTPIFNSPYFSLLEMNDQMPSYPGCVQVKHKDMMDQNFQKGIMLMTYSPLSGFMPLFNEALTTKEKWETAEQVAYMHKTNSDGIVQGVKSRYYCCFYDAIFHEANKYRYYRAITLTEELNRRLNKTYTLAHILNAYVLAHGRTDFIVIGPTNTVQLKHAIEALEIVHWLKKPIGQAILNYLYDGAADLKSILDKLFLPSPLLFSNLAPSWQDAQPSPAQQPGIRKEDQLEIARMQSRQEALVKETSSIVVASNQMEDRTIETVKKKFAQPQQ